MKMILTASRDSVTLPETRKNNEPLVDDLSTLAPGWKVAVYPSGEVKKIKDVEYQPTALDATVEFETHEEPTSSDQVDDLADVEIDEKIETDVDIKLHKSKKGARNIASNKVETSGVEDGPKRQEKAATSSKKKKATEDSSDDEGDMLEEEYMKELDMLEEEADNETNKETDSPPQKIKITKTKPAVKASKNLNIKKKANH